MADLITNDVISPIGTESVVSGGTISGSIYNPGTGSFTLNVDEVNAQVFIGGTGNANDNRVYADDAADRSTVTIGSYSGNSVTVNDVELRINNADITLNSDMTIGDNANWLYLRKSILNLNGKTLTLDKCKLLSTGLEISGLGTVNIIANDSPCWQTFANIISNGAVVNTNMPLNVYEDLTVLSGGTLCNIGCSGNGVINIGLDNSFWTDGAVMTVSGAGSLLISQGVAIGAVIHGADAAQGIEQSKLIVADGGRVDLTTVGTLTNGGVIEVSNGTLAVDKLVNNNTIEVCGGTLTAGSGIVNNDYIYLNATLKDQTISGSGWIYAENAEFINITCENAIYAVDSNFNGGSFGMVGTGYGFVDGAWSKISTSVTTLSGTLIATEWYDYGIIRVQENTSASITATNTNDGYSRFMGTVDVDGDLTVNNITHMYNADIDGTLTVNGGLHLLGNGLFEVNGALNIVTDGNGNDGSWHALYIGAAGASPWLNSNTVTMKISGNDAEVNIIGKNGTKAENVEICYDAILDQAASLVIADGATFVTNGDMVVHSKATLSIDAQSSVKAASISNNGFINLVGSTLTAGNINLGKQGIKVNNVDDPNSASKINVSVDSKIVADSITFNFDNLEGATIAASGKNRANINIDISDDAVAGLDKLVYKLIDVTGDSALDFSRIRVKNWDTLVNINQVSRLTFGDYMVAGIGNDVYLVKGDKNTLYVNTAWASCELGEVIDETRGLVYGFNAFASMNDAQASLGNINKLVVTVNVESDADFVLANGYDDRRLTYNFVNNSGKENVTLNIIDNNSKVNQEDWVRMANVTVGAGVSLESRGSYFYVSQYDFNNGRDGVDRSLDIYGTVDADYVYMFVGNINVYDGGKLLVNNGEGCLQVKVDSTLTVNAGGFVEAGYIQVWNAPKLSGIPTLDIKGGTVHTGSVNTCPAEAHPTDKKYINVTDGGELVTGKITTDANTVVAVNNAVVNVSGNFTNHGAATVSNSVLDVDGTFFNDYNGVTISGSTVRINKLDNDHQLFIEGENTIQIEDATGSSYAIRCRDGVVFNDSYIKATDNFTTRLLGSATFNGGFATAYLQGSSGGVGGTVTIDGLVDVSYGVDFSNNYVLNGGTIRISSGNSEKKFWGCVFQSGTYTINTDIEVIGGGATLPIHFTGATATINSKITQRTSGGEPIYLKNSNVTLGATGVIDTDCAVHVNEGSEFHVYGKIVNGSVTNNTEMYLYSGAELNISALTNNGSFESNGAYITVGTVTLDNPGLDKETELYNTKLDVTGNSISVKEGSLFFVYEYSSLNGENATMTINNGAAVVVDASSTITLDAVNFVGDGCLNIELYDINTSDGWKTIYNGGVVKVVDLDMANGIDQSRVFLLQDDDQNASLFFGEDGDIYVTDTEISRDKVYVNSEYTGEFGSVTSDGHIIGINAFNSIEAIGSTEVQEIEVGGGSVDNLISSKNDSATSVNVHVSGGEAETVIGGVWAKAENLEAGKTAAIGNVALTVSGDASLGMQVYAGGYFYGAKNTSAPDAPQMTVDSVAVALGGDSKVMGNVFGGIHARQNSSVSVAEVSISIDGGNHNRVYAGGWAEGNSYSYVAKSTVNVISGEVGFIYGGGANGQGETVVGETTITVGKDAKVDTIFMSGRYGFSKVEDKVTLNYYSDNDLKRLSGVSSAGVDNAGETVVNLFADLTADAIDYVDEFVINEGFKLTSNGEFLLGDRKNGTSVGYTTFNFKTDGLDQDETWDAIAGISDFTNARFAVNGGELMSWNGVGVLEIGNYELTYDKEEKLVMLTQKNA